MKKKFSAFLISLTAIILAVIMASGCSFISESAKNNGTVSPSDSEVAAQSVNFNTTAKTRDIEDALLDAVEQVERSSVMIMTDDGGAGSGVIVDISFDDKEGDENYASWKNDDNIVYIVTCHHVT